ncbi:MAG: dihydrolipoamide dehydrogenase, partial [Nanoarchaeota archaeon]|nr:dihydrolipoamide dehydrogenase [Nanoarchaeota archaeon]
FTQPQIAGVGLTEQEAIEQKKKYVVGKYYYKDTGMGEALAEKDGFVKLIVDQKTKEILGCHILGPNASILLHEVCIAMKAGKSKALDLLRNTVHVHPALSEVINRAALNVDV